MSARSLVVSAVFCLPLSCLAAGDVLQLTTHDLPPYSYREGAGQRLRGVAVEVVDCALTRIGKRYEVQVVPWARAQRLVQNGEADGFFAGSRNAERDGYAVLSSIIADQQWRWYLMAGHPADPLDADFRSKATVGSFIGANMLDWLRENGFRVEAAPPTTEGLLKMLRVGRIDAILANNLVMERLIREQGLEGKLRSVLQEDKPLGVYFSKAFLASNPRFLERFNEQVTACRKFAR